MEPYGNDSIREWSKERLVKEAENLYGLKLGKNMSKDEMIAAFLEAGDDQGERDKMDSRSGPSAKAADSPRVRIIFHNQEGPGGSEDIFVSVNGRAYLIKREHEVSLPPEVMRVIENAEQSVFERGADNRLREKLIKRYSYTILRDAA